MHLLWLPAMRRVLVTLTLLGATATASADIDNGPGRGNDTLEAQQRELGLPSRYELTGGGLAVDAFAQLAGGGATRGAREGNVAIGGELRVVADECVLVRVGGQARVAWNGEANPSAEQWASGCLAAGPVLAVLGHHLEWDVRPALLAPLRLRAGQNRRETVSLHLQPASIPLSDFIGADDSATGNVVFFDLRTHWTFLWSKGGPLAMQQFAEASPFRYHRAHVAPWAEQRDYIVDVGAGGGTFTDAAASVHFWFFHIENLALGPLYATGGAGIVSASAGELVAEFENEVEITTPRVELAIETGDSQVHGQLRFTHDATIAPDGYAVVEARLAGGLRVDLARRSRTRLGLDASLASTTVHLPRVMPLAGRTGGGSLSLARGLGAHLEATLQLDVARSFYAPDAEIMTGGLPSPRWGMQALATLQARIGR
ncbi:MAG: hypothetical protein H0T89_34495 [Deltaproteobacteria bacterium]|nr:hypothetical protein [Deltaproteobacteria bacterium]